MNIAVGGDEPVLIEGDAEELRGLVETIEDAIDSGRADGVLMDDGGVVDVVIYCRGNDGPGDDEGERAYESLPLEETGGLRPWQNIAFGVLLATLVGAIFVLGLAVVGLL